MSPQALKVTRVSGAENTFFIVNLFNPAAAQQTAGWGPQKKADFAKHICTDFFDFQTDGVLFLKPQAGYDFAWDFYNSDGSAAEMCGNAARCATVYFHEFVQNKKEISFLTVAGEIKGEVLSSRRVSVTMTKIVELIPELKLEGVTGFFVNTGVPHFVVLAPPQKELAQKLRFHPHFGQAGSNVTFMEVMSANEAKAVTFERGVENFTQACGTGAVAAACLLDFQNKTNDEAKGIFKIHMPGGLLEIQNAKLNQKPLLTGPVKIEFHLEPYGDNI